MPRFMCWSTVRAAREKVAAWTAAAARNTRSAVVAMLAILAIVAALPAPQSHAQSHLPATPFASAGGYDPIDELIKKYPACQPRDVTVDGNTYQVITNPACPSMVAVQIVGASQRELIEASAEEWLPSHRWADAFGHLHSRLGAGAFDDIPQRATNGLSSAVLSGAQFLAGLRTKLVLWGVYTGGKVRDAALSIDSLWGAFGEAIFGSGLLLIAFVVAAVSGIWRYAFRNKMLSARAAFKDLAVSAMLIVLFLAFLGTAQNSNTRTGPATGSPAWLTLTAMNAIDEIASGPNEALATIDQQFESAGGGDTTGEFSQVNGVTYDGNPHCRQYIAALYDGFRAQSRVSGAGLEGAASAVIADDALTMATLGTTWYYAQFGSLDVGRKVGCIELESVSGTSEAQQNRIAAAAGWNVNPKMFGPFTSNKESDKTVIAFVACRGDNTGTDVGADGLWAFVAPNMDSLNKADVATGHAFWDVWREECQSFWTNADIEGPFNFEDSQGQVKARTNFEGSGEIRSFLTAWHGEQGGLTLTAALGAFVSQLILLVIIGMIAIGCMLAAVGLIVAVPLVGPVVMAFAAFPGKQSSVKKFWSGVGGMVAARALFVLSLSALSAVTQVLLRIFPPGTDVLGALFVSFYVLIAAVVLHMAMKKAGLPSVFTPKGAMAIGFATLGGGAALAGAFSGARRLRSQSRRMRSVARGAKARVDALTRGGKAGGARSEKGRLATAGVGSAAPAPARGSKRQSATERAKDLARAAKNATRPQRDIGAERRSGRTWGRRGAGTGAAVGAGLSLLAGAPLLAPMGIAAAAGWAAARTARGAAGRARQVREHVAWRASNSARRTVAREALNIWERQHGVASTPEHEQQRDEFVSQQIAEHGVSSRTYNRAAKRERRSSRSDARRRAKAGIGPVSSEELAVPLPPPNP